MIYVIAIGTFQAFAAVLLLCTNRLKSKADALLIFLLLCIAAHLATKFYIYTVVSDLQVRFQMNTFIGFCYGPLLYLYALKNKDESFIPASRWYVFLPFMLGAIGYLTVISVLSLSQPAGYAALRLYNLLSTWTMLAVGAFFPLLALGIARKYLTHKPQEKQLIEWISYCLLTITAIGLFFQTTATAHWIEHNDGVICRDIVYSILLIICLIIIRYKYVAIVPASSPAIKTAPATIPVGKDLLVSEPIPVGITAPVIAQETIAAAEVLVIPARKLQLTTAEHKQIVETLEQHLRHTRIFTDAELNMDKLAASAGISKYHLSEALNAYAGKSFYQFINELRIERAIQQMQFMSSKALPVNVLTLAFDCGFKAKSSFNQYFKKITGVTPTEYLRAFARNMNAETL
jgi:AraC-like DNA-binding protein